MSDLEARLRTALDEDASRAPLVGVMPDHVRSRVRRRRARTVLTSSVAAGLLIVGSVFASRTLDRSAVVPAPPVPVAPISKHWMLEHSLGISHVYASRATWSDAPDASVPGVDITRLVYRRTYHWDLELSGRPPRERGRTEVLSYGLVLDTTKDGVPDYLVGIEDDPTPPSDFADEYHSSLPPQIFRVWVTDLATGKTDEQIGPPYGYPIEFGHPDERFNGPSMWFTFLDGSEPDDLRFRSVRFYAWASLTSHGEVVARDVAPDDGWMTIGLGIARR